MSEKSATADAVREGLRGTPRRRRAVRRGLLQPALRVLGAARPAQPAARRGAASAAVLQEAHRMVRQVVRRVDWGGGSDSMADTFVAHLPLSVPLVPTRPRRRHRRIS